MAKAKITIIGEIEKFKVHEDGTVNIIIKADTSTAVPNGLKELGSSTYNITVSKKMSRINSLVTELCLLESLKQP